MPNMLAYDVAIVISPLLALMEEQRSKLIGLGFQAATINGLTSEKDAWEIWRDARTSDEPT